MLVTPTRLAIQEGIFALLRGDRHERRQRFRVYSARGDKRTSLLQYAEPLLHEVNPLAITIVIFETKRALALSNKSDSS